MARPLTVQGVGEGDQECQWEARIPIVVPVAEGRAAGLHHFEAPTVGGSGVDLPVLVGLKSMQRQGVVL